MVVISSVCMLTDLICNGTCRQGFEDSIVHDDLEFSGLPWGQVSGSANDMIRQMLRKDPEQWPSAQQLLQHPWFTLEEPGLDQPLDGVMRLLSVAGSSHVL